MKKKNGAGIWLCSICGKEITGDHEAGKTGAGEF